MKQNLDAKENKEMIIQGKNGTLLSDSIKSEVNFLVLPFFALRSKDIKNRTKTEYKTVVKRGQEKFEVLWRVTSDPEYGYPGPFDREVHKAVEQIINGIPLPIQNPIPIGSLYNLCKIMGINKFGGSQYSKIKEALERITTTSIKSAGTFYSLDRKEWIEDIFHLYERVIFKGKRLLSGDIADTNYLYLNSWYLDNINTHYVKPINWELYKSLGTPIAQRLYDLLSVKFYGLLMRDGKFICYKYSTICDLLPIAKQKYLSLARKVLDSAHQRLKDTAFIENWNWEQTSKKGEENDWLIKYYPGKIAKEEIKKYKKEDQLELALPSVEVKAELPSYNDKPLLTDVQNSQELAGNHTANQLTQRGITNTVANTLFKNFPIDQIQKQIEIFDYLVENKSPLVAKNPAGFLRRSIEENYQPPAEYNQKQEREILEQKRNQEIAEKEAEQARLDDIQRQVDDYRDGLKDEERQLLRQKAVEVIDGDNSIKKAFVTEHLIRAKENDIIRERLRLE